MDRVRYEYVTYISSTPEKVWNALIDGRMTKQYWQHENRSEWSPGSRWEHRRSDEEDTLDLVGKVIQSAPPRRLVLTWADPEDEELEDKHSRVTFDIEPYRKVTRLAVTHEGLEPGSEMLEGITDGWPKVLSSMKSLLEVGEALPKLW